MERLDGLIHEQLQSKVTLAIRFQPIIVQWRELVQQHIQHLITESAHRHEIANPYIVGVPLTEQQRIFVGRTDISTRIEHILLEQHAPVLLYGQRRMGKTSLLYNLGRLLPSTVLPFFVDGQILAGAGDYADFLYALASAMVKAAQRSRSLPLSRPARHELAATPFTCFTDWLDDVERALARHQIDYALLAFDELEMLDQLIERGRFDTRDVLSLLRHIIQHRPHFRMVVAGSHTIDEFRRWASYLINLQVVKVGYLTTDEILRLVEAPLDDFALRYTPTASAHLVTLTRGHPNLVQLLCSEIVRHKNQHLIAQRHTASIDDVEAAARHALQTGDFIFAEMANRAGEVGVQLLQCIASQGAGAIVTPDTLARQISAPIDTAIELLLRRDLIEHADDGYRFQIELARRWFARLKPGSLGYTFESQAF